jgi:hypothetical protein
VFTIPIQSFIEWKRIKFYIQNTHQSNDKSLRKYEQSTGRTLPERRRTLTPKEGEIVLEVTLRGRERQISIHPRFLIPWEPVVGDGVVVIRGYWTGTPGVAKEQRDGSRWIVTFSLEETGKLRDYEFIEKDLAAIEPLGA